MMRDLHLCCLDQRHVGKSSHMAMTTQSDGESCLHVGFVEARESSAGIRRLHLRHGHGPDVEE